MNQYYDQTHTRFEYDWIMQERWQWEETIVRDPNQTEVPYVGVVNDWDPYEIDSAQNIDDNDSDWTIKTEKKLKMEIQRLMMMANAKPILWQIFGDSVKGKG